MDGWSQFVSHGHVGSLSPHGDPISYVHVALDDSVEIGPVVANGISFELDGIVVLSEGIVDNTERPQRF